MVRVSLALTLLLSAAAPAAAQNWPAFRGPDASGVAPAGRPPATWDAATSKNVAWVTMATPALSGNMLIVRTQTQLVGIGS